MTLKKRDPRKNVHGRRRIMRQECENEARLRRHRPGVGDLSPAEKPRRHCGNLRPVVAHCDRRTPRLRRIPSPSIPSVRRTVRLRIMPRHAPAPAGSGSRTAQVRRRRSNKMKSSRCADCRSLRCGGTGCRGMRKPEAGRTADFSAALAGNPNCGKTTLFNALTGGRMRTGNWPGVTVERRDGLFRGDGFTAAICDLPGDIRHSFASRGGKGGA